MCVCVCVCVSACVREHMCVCTHTRTLSHTQHSILPPPYLPRPSTYAHIACPTGNDARAADQGVGGREAVSKSGRGAKIRERKKRQRSQVKKKTKKPGKKKRQRSQVKKDKAASSP
jgi:hypothetical protein